MQSFHHIGLVTDTEKADQRCFEMLKCWATGVLLVIVGLTAGPAPAQGNRGCGGQGYREAADQVIRRLALKPGQVIVDVGAGDGWWSKRMAAKIGPDGVIHAAEISEQKVNTLKRNCADTPQIRPYLCSLDNTGLEENTCDLAFISKTYHHFNKDGQLDYLRHLKRVIKPNGRLVILERHAALATGRGRDHAEMPGLLIQQAEKAGWILLRCELLRGSDHFMATFISHELVEKRLARAKPKRE